MLLQTVGRQIYLLPAWPQDWDVDFQFHAPHNTIVEAKVRGGQLVRWKITPESRSNDAVLPATK